MENKIIIKLGKYIFLPFFIIIFFATIMGRERLAKFFIGDPNSLFEEYLLVSFLLILYDVYRTIANKFYH